jgi:8-amino-7-oxononanoate synthase
MSPWPLTPRATLGVGFRIQTTAANTDPEITHLLQVLRELADRSQLRPRQR